MEEEEGWGCGRTEGKVRLARVCGGGDKDKGCVEGKERERLKRGLVVVEEG